MTEQNLNTEPSNSTKPVLCEVVLASKFNSAYVMDSYTKQNLKYQKIADDYAIKFASWYLSTRFDSSGKYLNKTDLELIEIFKRDIFHNLT
jgi:hypothetical protein